MKAELADGRILEFADGTTPEVVQQAVKRVMAMSGAPQDSNYNPKVYPRNPNLPTIEIIGGANSPKIAPTTEQKVRASIPGRAVQGALFDPINGYAQLATHALPDNMVNAVNSGTQYLNDLPYLGPVMKTLGMVPATSGEIDAGIHKNEQEYEAARVATGNEGSDFVRAAGNVLSPINWGMGKLAPIKAAAPLMAKIVKGGFLGALGGAAQPVDMVDDKTPYWGTKALQTGVGTAGGAVLTPILSKLGDVLTRKINVFRTDPEVAGARASQQTDSLIAEALREMGQRVEDIPAGIMQQLRSQVAAAMMQGKKLDPAALLRQKDFQDAGMQGTLGQITRDSTQFARERNLRGVANVGEPLMQRFDQQNQWLQRAIGQHSEGAKEPFPAGEDLISALSTWDETMRGKVGAAYQAARASSGKDMDVPLKSLAQDYAQVLRDYGKANIPGAIRARLDELGLLSGKQTKVFTAQDADELLQVINKHYDPSKKAEKSALDALRNAVKSAVLSADDQGGVFAPAVKAAKMRFDLHDAVPALKAAADGTVAADDFVKRFVLNGKTVDVQMLAKLLSETEPAAFQQARKQIGAKLENAAFGQNTTGDKIFSAERYAKELAKYGTDKLSAFYSPTEIAQLNRIARVGAYINSTPSSAPVNYSNNAGWATSLIGKIPGLPATVSLASAVKNTVGNQNFVRRAMAAQPATAKTDLTPEQIRLFSQYLAAGAGGAGAVSAEPLK